MEMTIQEHEDVTLTCVISGSPKPTITWDREGGNIPTITRTNTANNETRNETTGVYMVRETETKNSFVFSINVLKKCHLHCTTRPFCALANDPRMKK